jgi:hypothetical protein
MIQLTTYHLPELIPQAEFDAWKRTLKPIINQHCPEMVAAFIEALADELPRFGQIGKINVLISGGELKLCGMDEWNGVTIDVWTMYPMKVPHMVAIDHRTAMQRIYRRKGKQGLIDYVVARLKGKDLQRVMDTLQVHVFKEFSPEYEAAKKAMNL